MGKAQKCDSWRLKAQQEPNIFNLELALEYLSKNILAWNSFFFLFCVMKDRYLKASLQML